MDKRILLIGDKGNCTEDVLTVIKREQRRYIYRQKAYVDSGQMQPRHNESFEFDTVQKRNLTITLNYLYLASYSLYFRQCYPIATLSSVGFWDIKKYLLRWKQTRNDP